MFKNADLRFCAYPGTSTARPTQLYLRPQRVIGHKFNPMAQNSVDQQEYKNETNFEKEEADYEISMKSESTE